MWSDSAILFALPARRFSDTSLPPTCPRTWKKFRTNTSTRSSAPSSLDFPTRPSHRAPQLVEDHVPPLRSPQKFSLNVRDSVLRQPCLRACLLPHPLPRPPTSLPRATAPHHPTHT